MLSRGNRVKVFGQLEGVIEKQMSLPYTTLIKPSPNIFKNKSGLSII